MNQTKPILPLLLFLAPALLAMGCSDFRANRIETLDDAVLAVDDTLGLARLVRIDGDELSRTEIEIAEGAAQLVVRPATERQVILFTQGVIGDADDETIPAEVVLVNRDGELGRWTLARPYGSVSVSANGRYAYALAPVGRLVLVNDIEVVDLERDAGEDNPFPLSLRSLGGEVPTAAAFSEPLAWTDGELRVAALFAAGQLSLFDLDAPAAPPVTIPTTTDASSVGPTPIEAIFVDTELVVRSQSGAQLLVVSLIAPGPDAQQRFDVSLRTLATTGPVTSLFVDPRVSEPRLVALSGQDLHLYDLETSLDTVVHLPASYAQVLPFEGTAPGDAASRPRFAVFGPVPSIAFVDLSDDGRDVLATSALPLAFTPTAVVADPARGRLVLFIERYGGGASLDIAASAGRAPVSVIDLYDRSALALDTTGEVDRAVVSADLSNMWLASETGYINRFDITTHEQTEIWLGEAIDTLLPLPGSGATVLAFYDASLGSFSILRPDGTTLRVDDAW